MRSISEIENDLDIVRRIDNRNHEPVDSADDSLAFRVFAVSSAKRRKFQSRN